MTKKHFIAIAELLAWHSADMTMIEGFADYFITVNPNFDKARFIDHVIDVQDEMLQQKD